MYEDQMYQYNSDAQAAAIEEERRRREEIARQEAERQAAMQLAAQQEAARQAQAQATQQPQQPMYPQGATLEQMQRADYERMSDKEKLQSLLGETIRAAPAAGMFSNETPYQKAMQMAGQPKPSFEQQQAVSQSLPEYLSPEQKARYSELQRPAFVPFQAQSGGAFASGSQYDQTATDAKKLAAQQLLFDAKQKWEERQKKLKLDQGDGLTPYQREQIKAQQAKQDLADRKQAAAEQKAEQALSKSKASVQGQVKTNLDIQNSLIENINQLIGDPEKNGREHPGLAGSIGYLDSKLPPANRDQATAQALIKGLLSKASVSGLQQIRSLGTAPGSITEREWPIFQNLIATLDPSQDEETFRQQLAGLRDKLLESRQGTLQRYEEQWGEKYSPGNAGEQPQQPRPQQPQLPKPKNAADQIAIINQARQAIASGKNRAAVISRLESMGIKNPGL